MTIILTNIKSMIIHIRTKMNMNIITTTDMTTVTARTIPATP